MIDRLLIAVCCIVFGMLICASLSHGATQADIERATPHALKWVKDTTGREPVCAPTFTPRSDQKSFMWAWLNSCEGGYNPDWLADQDYEFACFGTIHEILHMVGYDHDDPNTVESESADWPFVKLERQYWIEGCSKPNTGRGGLSERKVAGLTLRPRPDCVPARRRKVNAVWHRNCKMPPPSVSLERRPR